MNVLTTQPRIDASQLPLESLAANHHLSDSDKVAEVARQFEAVLVRQIMQDIRKPVLAPSEGSAAVTGIYNDMLNNQMADTITRSGGLGLAKSLAAQLSHQVLQQASASPGAASAPAQTAPAKKPFRP